MKKEADFITIFNDRWLERLESIKGEEEEKVTIESIRANWVSQGNAKRWRLLWQRAQEPEVYRLLLQAAQVASNLQDVTSANKRQRR